MLRAALLRNETPAGFLAEDREAQSAGVSLRAAEEELPRGGGEL